MSDVDDRHGSAIMKFLIAGAGAIGAYIGARMAQAGLDVTLFARGPHLRALQEHGVQVKSSEGDFVARPTIASSLEDVGPVDVVFLGVKAHGLAQLAPQLRPVLGPHRMAFRGGTFRVSVASGRDCAWSGSIPAA
jgi:2-dehydropantoate 2-reductase